MKVRATRLRTYYRSGTQSNWKQQRSTHFEAWIMSKVKMLVPIDFSEKSEHALDFALTLSQGMDADIPFPAQDPVPSQCAEPHP